MGSGRRAPELATVVVVARESTAATIAERGIDVQSVLLGDFVAHPRAETSLREPVDVVIVATKATGLAEALERVDVTPCLVLPLLNGLDHLAVLRERFPAANSGSRNDPRRGRPAPARRGRAHKQVSAGGDGLSLCHGAPGRWRRSRVSSQMPVSPRV